MLSISNLQKNPYFLIVVSFVFGMIMCYIYCHCTMKNNKEHYNEPKGEIIMFYANWCPHCTSFKPKFVEFKEQQQSNPTVNVKMYEEAECPKHLMQKFEVSGFPTVVYHESSTNKTVNFRGERSVNGLETFLKDVQS